MADTAQAVHDPLRMRSAGRDLLSLALIDARNHLLRWLAAFEPHAQALRGLPPQADADPPMWLVGRAAWFQEYWIGRNTQRQRGERADATAPRLPSLLEQADARFDPRLSERAARWRAVLPDAAALRSYLADSLDTTLDLLSSTPETDEALFVFRLALQHEDRLCEALAVCAQTLQLDLPEAPAAARPARVECEPVYFGAQRVALGSVPGGFVPFNERWAGEEAVPEFEIDAQAVSWTRFAEFALDGGYDRAELWSEPGWRWVQAQERRAPRHVEQMRESVLVQRGGRMQRVPGAQPVVHVSQHEAQAWCRWAGRRLPTEVEWELAALGGASRGFVWGDVFEWVAGTARPYPGAPSRLPSGTFPAPGSQGVLRGASWMTRSRQRHPRARRFALPQRDEFFAGFRSCAL